MEKTVRTRFAPSPTGYMHLGNLRSALYTYLYARHNGGRFILRIEDTDRERYVEGATEVIYRTLRSIGMDWDEGPDVGGRARRDVQIRQALPAPAPGRGGAAPGGGRAVRDPAERAGDRRGVV